MLFEDEPLFSWRRSASRDPAPTFATIVAYECRNLSPIKPLMHSPSHSLVLGSTASSRSKARFSSVNSCCWSHSARSSETPETVALRRLKASRALLP